MFFIILLTFVVLNSILFCFPTILHKKKVWKNKTCRFFVENRHKKIMHISHRGGSIEALENSIEAFRNSTDIGTNMLEIDVKLTKDGKVVIFHDDDLSRICGVSRPIEELNYAEVPPAMSKIELQYSKKGTYQDLSQVDKSKLKIPLLDDLFQAYPGIPINLEAKSEEETLVYETNKVIKRFSRTDDTLFGVMNPSLQRKMRELNPECPQWLGVWTVFYIYLFYVLGLLSFLPIDEQFMQIPLMSAESVRFMAENDLKTGSFQKRMLIRFMNLLCPFTRPMIWHLQRRGLLVVYWVLNKTEEYEEAIQMGADGIMTDKPTLLNEFLKARRLFHDERA